MTQDTPIPTANREQGQQAAEPPSTFDAFWLFYLRQHAHARTRYLHFAGTALAAAALVGAIVWHDYREVFLAVALGYALAWLGHAAIERNRPATFRKPLWSFAADIRMFRLWLMGALTPELARAGVPVRRRNQ